MNPIHLCPPGGTASGRRFRRNGFGRCFRREGSGRRFRRHGSGRRVNREASDRRFNPGFVFDHSRVDSRFLRN